MAYDLRQRALIVEVVNRMAMQKQTDAAICQATSLSQAQLDSMRRTKDFRTAFEDRVRQINQTSVQKYVNTQYGSDQEFARVRKDNARKAYNRIVKLSEEAESEQVKFKANLWVALAGGIQAMEPENQAAKPTLILNAEAVRLIEKELSDSNPKALAESCDAVASTAHN